MLGHDQPVFSDASLRRGVRMTVLDYVQVAVGVEMSIAVGATSALRLTGVTLLRQSLPVEAAEVSRIDTRRTTINGAIRGSFWQSPAVQRVAVPNPPHVMCVAEPLRVVR